MKQATRPGYELVREQLFFRKELIERVSWFIRLRWVAAGTALAVGWAYYLFIDPGIAVIPLTLVILFIAFYNIIFHFVHRHLSASGVQQVEPFTLFAHAQIGLDLLSLFCLIYYTGGIYSPLLIFVIFHIILAGILLAPASSFIYAVVVLLAIAGLIGLEHSGRTWPRTGFHDRFFAEGLALPWGLVPYLVFASAILITAYLVTTVKLSLRSKGRELLMISKQLDESNDKLTALYEMVMTMGRCTDLKELMDLATLNAATIMGVKGCSIKLLDEQRKTLRFASTHGLSEDYLAKGGIDIEKSPINRRVLEGSFYTIGKIEEKNYFQYPEEIRKEGIASMICLPLRVEKMVLGVFCVYSDEYHRFGENDIDFFSLMAELTALAIENLKSELNRTWFLQKAAHQLRSPLNAVYGMLQMLRKDYLGGLNEKQRDTLMRCEKRLELLDDIIKDLLKIGIERAAAPERDAAAVDPRDILNSLMGLYAGQAAGKGIEIAFEIGDPVPRIAAEARLLDDLMGNLISNAVKYTPAGGKVRVFLSVEGQERVRFEVSDTGIGISDEEIPCIFSEFFRGEDARAFSENGTGLGLVIVKEVLDRLKGTVTVESKKGKGTRFICRLPAGGAG